MLRSLRPFYIFAALLVLAALVLEHINGRFWLNDFRVYYMAATDLRHGLPIYGVVFGEDTGLYKYLPFPLYFFVPFTFLSFTVAATIHWLLMGILLIACFPAMERALSRLEGPVPKPALRSTLGLLCIAVLLVRELHLGNINLGLLFLVIWGVERLLAGKTRVAGLALGIAWLIKPYLLLMVVPVIRREWKVLGTAGAGMAVGLLLPMLVEGPSKWWAMLVEWGQAVARHNLTIESPDRISAILASNLHLSPTTWIDLLFIVFAGVILAVVTWYYAKGDNGKPSVQADRAMVLWTASAIVPNLVITDQQHFMFTLPLILYIIAGLFKYRDRWVLLLFLIAMLPYATRSSDLWGSALENTLAGHGVLGMGNLFLIGAAWLAHTRWRSLAAKRAPEAS